MAENTTLARPYARAAFEAANSEDGGLQRWSEQLGLAASFARDPAIQALLASPQYDDQFKAGLFLDLCGEQLAQDGRNFIKLLAENDRLNILPEIHAVFEELRADAEKTIEAEVITAFEIDDAQRQKISDALSRRLQRDVVLNCTVDQSLIGGVIVRAGDLVIDGSARGKLVQLAQTLRH